MGQSDTKNNSDGKVKMGEDQGKNNPEGEVENNLEDQGPSNSVENVFL